MSDTNAIRTLNDRFRGGDITIPGKWVLTRGLADLLEETNRDASEVAHLVQTYDDFTPENDPNNEHDFGVFICHDQKCFWKLDYYDPTLQWGSEDPSDATKTMQVLTIMLASEY